MLSQQTIAIIKSTVPVLEVHGEAITTYFYKTMFENHPELLHIFNHANQKQGRQQRALANSVYHAAKYIDQLETILPLVKQIAHKHRSLGILPAHYSIVGEHLLMAIKDVLGDAATPEIIEAWAEAYGVIADAFISVEAEMYDEAAQQPGGWKEFRDFTIVDIQNESDVITSFYLKPADGAELASFTPGQYISLKLQVPGTEYTQIRQYSLSAAPGKDYYRISVKREAATEEKPAGVVSNYLHDHARIGDTVLVSAPAGDFVLDTSSTKPVVLLSGGVGLTPLVSMLTRLAEEQPERDVTFIHAAINGSMHALKEEVSQIAAASEHIKAYTVYETPLSTDEGYDVEGYVTTEWLRSVLPTIEAVYYFCGPIPFMKAVRSSLLELGVSEENIHFEFFGPKADL